MILKPSLPIQYYILLLVITLFSCNRAGEEETLNIATAANMQFAMKELVIAFSKKTNIKCQTIISSSGKLTAQIKAGAPYDVFVSADMKYPMELYQSKKTLKEPAIYAYGQLILWSAEPNKTLDMTDLSSDFYKKIALANPKTAPYGVATMEVLEHFKIKNKIENKLVFGESIAQTNQFILSGAADIGFTAQSVVRRKVQKEVGSWMTLPKDSYQSIEQGVILLNTREEQKQNAQQFFDFLFTPTAQNILSDYGYLVTVKK